MSESALEARASRRTLGWILAVALSLRLLAFGLTHETAPAGDERGYLERAEALARGEVSQTMAKRPPTSAVWGSVFVRALGPGDDAIRWANLIAGLALVAATYGWVQRGAGPKVATVASLVVALLPEQVFYDVSLWSESLYAFLLVAAVGWASRGIERPADAVVLGILFGLAALTREVGLLAFGATLLVLAASRAVGARPAAVAIVALGVTILPWSVWISQEGGRLALISQTPNQNLFLGNWQYEDPEEEASRLAGPRKRAKYEALGDTQAERERAAGQLAWEAIGNRMPFWPLEKVGSELPATLAPVSIPAARWRARPENSGWEQRWAYRTSETMAGLRDGVAAGTVAAWVALLLLAGVGATLGATRAAPWAMLGALAVAHLVPAVLAFGITRFRMPCVPLLAFAVGLTWAKGPALWREATPRRRGAAVGVGAILLWALWLGRHAWSQPGFG